jgi:hypothetical protein
MNAKQLIARTLVAAGVAFTGTAALADDITMVKDDFVSTQSREQVRAEVLKARAAGTLVANHEAASFGFAGPNDSQGTAHAVTRETVRKAAIEARRAPAATDSLNSDWRA